MRTPPESHHHRNRPPRKTQAQTPHFPNHKRRQIRYLDSDFRPGRHFSGR
jgi:hypothetical protein